MRISYNFNLFNAFHTLGMYLLIPSTFSRIATAGIISCKTLSSLMNGLAAFSLNPPLPPDRRLLNGLHGKPTTYSSTYGNVEDKRANISSLMKDVLPRVEAWADGLKFMAMNLRAFSLISLLNKCSCVSPRARKLNTGASIPLQSVPTLIDPQANCRPAAAAACLRKRGPHSDMAMRAAAGTSGTESIPTNLALTKTCFEHDVSVGFADLPSRRNEWHPLPNSSARNHAC